MKFVKSRSAFTLIELLVVIAIIALLASLLLGVIGRTKLAAYQTQSMANLRQWGTALQLELADNRQLMPWEGQPVALARTDAWYNMLPPYMNERTLAQLSADKQLPQAGVKSVWMNLALPTWLNKTFAGAPIFAYSMNYWLSNSSKVGEVTSTSYTQLSMLRVEHASAVVFLAEKGDNFANCNPAQIKATFQDADIWKSDGTFTAVKGAAANFLFCDGHVELKKRTEFDKNFFTASTGRTDPLNTKDPDKTFTFIPFVGASN